jgi:excisionase family DNA binding protein
MDDDPSLNLAPKEIAAAFASSDTAAKFPSVLTIDQVAQLLQVPKATVYDWSSRGLLSGCSRRIGKYRRFWRDRLLQKIFNEGLDPDGK